MSQEITSFAGSLRYQVLYEDITCPLFQLNSRIDKPDLNAQLRGLQNFIAEKIDCDDVDLKDPNIQKLFDQAIENAIRKAVIYYSLKRNWDMPVFSYAYESFSQIEALHEASISEELFMEEDLVVVENRRTKDEGKQLLSQWEKDPSLLLKPPLQDPSTEERLNYIRNTLLPKAKELPDEEGDE